MRLLYKDNPRTLVVFSNTYSLTFRTNLKQTQLPKPTVNLELVPNTSITSDEEFKPLLKKDIYGCLGLMYVEKQIFLAVITSARKGVASPIQGETVDNIQSVEFISLNNNEWDFVELDSQGYPILSPEEMEEDKFTRTQHPCIEYKKLLSNRSFYYSNDFDLTSTLQSRGVEDTLDTIGHYQPQYMWNSFLIDDMIKFRSNLDRHNQLILDDNRFLTMVIRGFAKSMNTREGNDDRISIISKQSWKRAGTRYNTRGIDDNGNVANFVETEFIYYNPSKSSVYTYTQVRGSVPTFWEQDSSLINPKVTLTRSLEATQPVFNKHFSDICKSYGVCHIIDLLSKTKSAEIQLSNRYRQLYQHCNLREEIEYTDFDFHQETKAAGGFDGATKILRSIRESMHQFGFFSYDLEQNQVITRQDGVFRVNCLDCLDRTNVIEQVISRTVLDIILKSQLGNGGNENSIRSNSIKQLHNSLWADNGDAISQIYTGTNALKSSFSRSGKMNIAGALSDVTKSVSRMYQNTFVDDKKQSTIDSLLGVAGPLSKKVKIYDPASEFVTYGLKQQSHVFSTSKKIQIFTGTYNVNALEPTNSIDLTPWLFPPENKTLPDIYAIGFQELIELNAGSIINSDASKPRRWAAILNEQLNSQKEQYALLRTESIASMSLFLFVKKSAVEHVTRVSGSFKKTGLGGIAANKGACAVRFEFGATSFALVTSHLAAGTTAVLERFNEYTTIMQGLVFTRNYSLQDHDHVIWFGDLNYRLNLPNYQCRELIEEGAIDEMMQSDQLKEELKSKGAFGEFSEGVVKFMPTYKFDKGTSDYDTSEKQRVPSWTDRILYLSAKKKRNDLEQINYNAVPDMFLSDHKPVYSTFQVTVEFVDKEKKGEIAKELYTSYRKEHGNLSDLVSLHSSSSTPTISSKTSESNFTSDTLNDVDLLDHFDVEAPSLPSRPHPNSSAPRRVPLPPAARKVIANVQPLPRKLPPAPQSYSILEDNNSKLPTRNLPPPAPPQSYFSLENTNSTSKVSSIEPSSVRVPIGFSASPLIPTSKSNSNTSSPIASPVPKVNNKAPETKPIIPLKPSALSSTKLKTIENSKEESEKPRSNTPTPPAPPAVRSTSLMTMADWKPLVPK
ncbi:INP53 [Candida oxycetoniae]|uniref:phosphoinositide 5-phosphatase n=1 Tax=Candida oxycetoniae TaxID=497107 RepID=A0AAI9T1X9_9ASCO|nr:INP53 [Candida oxycetoniae]KAI3406570.2 INP53 [Candida oxycetoniae]